MAKPKNDRRRKSVSEEAKREPIEIEVRFDAPAPSPLAFPGTEVTGPPAKKSDGPKRPPLIFRF